MGEIKKVIEKKRSRGGGKKEGKIIFLKGGRIYLSLGGKSGKLFCQPIFRTFLPEKKGYLKSYVNKSILSTYFSDIQILYYYKLFKHNKTQQK